MPKKRARPRRVIPARKVSIQIVGSNREVVETLEWDIPESVIPPPTPRLPKALTTDAVIAEFFEAFASGSIERKQRAFRLLKKHAAWESALQRMLTMIDSGSHPEMKHTLRDLWMTHGLARSIRQLVGNDKLLMTLIRRSYGAYQGPPLSVIYRAEDKRNINSNFVGFAWTTSQEWGRMHLGLRKSGVLLRAINPPLDAIWAKVQSGIGEQEYCVDVGRLQFTQID